MQGLNLFWWGACVLLCELGGFSESSRLRRDICDERAWDSL